MSEAIGEWCVWTQDAQEFHDFFDDVPAWAILTQLTGFVLLSVAMITFGILMVKGPMPRWLGYTFAACGLLVYPTGLLPLWYYVGAVVLGIAGLRRYATDGPRTPTDRHAEAAHS